MRMIVIKQGTSAQSLSTLLGGSAGVKPATMEQIETLNPHVDFQQLAAGTVLLVPDLPGIDKGETSSVGGQGFDSFREQVGSSVDAAIARVRQGYDAQTRERSEVSAALKSAAVKRLLEADPDLRPQLDAAAQVWKKDQASAKDSEAVLKAVHDGAAAELAALARLLG